MAEPASTTLLAVHKLITGLVEKIQDRKLAAEMREISVLVSKLQSEHFDLQNSALEMRSETMELKHKLAALQKQATDAEEKFAKATAENELLRTKVTELDALVPKASNQMDRTKEQLLLLLWKNSDWHREDQIAQTLGHELEKVKFLLLDLHNDKSTLYRVAFGRAREWKIGQAGRGYLIRRGLV
jgi:hypothetical protein